MRADIAIEVTGPDGCNTSGPLLLTCEEQWPLQRGSCTAFTASGRPVQQLQQLKVWMLGSKAPHKWQLHWVSVQLDDHDMVYFIFHDWLSSNACLTACDSVACACRLPSTWARRKATWLASAHCKAT